MPILLALALAADGCRTIDEGVRLCPAHLPAVRRLTVASVGPTSADEDCRGFRPVAMDIRRYLRRAERTDDNTVHYALPESQCVSSGRLVLADGRRGAWRVDRFAIMRLRLDRTPAIVLYCPGCRAGGFRH